jgi:site-specific DNA-methyltransferase (adenine-specific)
MEFKEIIEAIPQQPYYLDLEYGQAIYCADCRDILPLIPDKSIDLVLTDPPYNVGIDYGSGAKGDRRDDYIPWLNDIWIRAARVVKDGSFLIYTNTTTFIPDGMKPPEPWRYFHLACWHKPLSLRPAFYGVLPHWEPIFINLKGDKPWRPFRSENIFNDVVSANVEFGSKDTHPCIKPLSLYKTLLLFGCPARGVILEPFLGSGITARGAKELGRKCIGIEIEGKYCEIAAKRLSQSVMRLEV